MDNVTCEICKRSVPTAVADDGEVSHWVCWDCAEKAEHDQASLEHDRREEQDLDGKGWTMSETEKYIQTFERLAVEGADPENYRGAFRAAIDALRAVKKLRDMVSECRGSGCTRVAVTCIEELLP